jgi:uncharacterized protein
MTKHINIFAIFVGCFLMIQSSWAGPWEDLLSAIKRDDASAVTTALLRGTDPNADILDQGPMLVVAARENSISVINSLLKLSQVDVNKSAKSGENGLMLAAFNGQVEIVKLFIKRGALVNKPDWSPLHYAAANGQLSVVELLVENHAYIDAESPNNTTPLMMAARHKHITVMRWLTENGADPTYKNQAGLSAASYMKRYGETEQEAWLLRKAKEFEAKFGTRDAPKLAPADVPTGVPVEAPAVGPK